MLKVKHCAAFYVNAFLRLYISVCDSPSCFCAILASSNSKHNTEDYTVSIQLGRVWGYGVIKQPMTLNNSQMF